MGATTNNTKRTMEIGTEDGVDQQNAEQAALVGDYGALKCLSVSPSSRRPAECCCPSVAMLGLSSA